jgi:glycosyltransferase involved in cell wall biosynthesis
VRLTYVIPYFPPAWGYGGPPRLAYDLARQLVSAGQSVKVLTTDALDGESRATPRREEMEGVRVLRLPNVSNHLAWKYKVFLPRRFRSALEAALSETDIVHLFDFRDYQNAVALPVLRRWGVPFVLSALGELPRAIGPKRPIKYVYDLLFGFGLVRSAAVLLAQTPAEAHWYTKLGARADRVRLLPLAVDLEALPVAGERGVFRSKHGLHDNDRVVLFLGRINAYKGLDVLLHAFAQLHSEHRDVRLVIAGRDDGYLGTAMRLAAKLAQEGSVLFPGAIYGDERFTAYRDADVFAITPSHAEQTSLAALEAAACGTPVLTTTHAPIPGLDTVGAGITVPYDVLAVRRGLEQLLDSGRTRAGARAECLVRERFSLTSVSRQLEAIYRDVASERT